MAIFQHFVANFMTVAIVCGAWLFSSWLFFWYMQKTNSFSSENSRAPRGYFFAWLFLRRENAAKTFEKIAVQNVAILYGRVARHGTRHLRPFNLRAYARLSQLK